MATKTASLIENSLVEFADALAARTATPGGGSMAAYLTATGAALVAMACRFTAGEKFAAVEASTMDAAAKLDELRPRALQLVDLDSRSYDAVTAAFALPKSDDAAKAARTAAVQGALKGALEVPFETMQLALAALELAAPVAAAVNPNLRSDCAVGARCLATALEGAFLNVRINAGSIKDAAYVAARMGESETMRVRARELSRRIAEAVEAP
ncbi:MAG TPA: cyclodeaminase/cyclohydrolase family protein [Planctomycetota bacterium]|nr:cyclodeaminase/cyclohydrolase family protein [Planctomycetota bacterium]